MAAAALSLDNPIFRMYMGYAFLVIIKTMAMSFVTAYFRITMKVYANEEDVAFDKKKTNKGPQIHPTVERVRRCHQNDLENVIPFVLMGLLYVATGPTTFAASLHFRIFTASRFLHTFFYLFSIPQPTRVLSFLVGVFTTLSMAYHVFAQVAF
ncbi:microsomal glutathione S-transferase 1 [Aplysia californica]|uniref:Microsomal glutathione S-transferase 1 n=1 Tax=Aplysia californica TaxID=6500 RepID=A0ABM0K808_APLCA|nr:microsomal glutathione S-transferase 1 [Aplysia californica]XP_005110983.1 microsomal glutathione S-transferase 1 [Aplysia californica]